MKKSKIKQLNNDGSALVIAIVVVAFISILTTILLYLATMNFQMKATDYNTKVSFYGAEIPLEALRTVLVKDVSDASTEAYKQVIAQYGDMSDNVRKSTYQNVFKEAFENAWKSRTQDPDDPTVYWNWIEGIENALGLVTLDTTKFHVIEDTNWTGTECDDPSVTTCNCPYHIILDSSIVSTDRLDIVEVTEGTDIKIHIELNGFRVVYTEGEFSSVIKTDYCVTIPEINWSVVENINSWDDTIDTDKKSHERKEVNFETCVSYMDWEKQ